MDNLKKFYTDFYINANVQKTYPNEYVIRTFLGSYPNLALDKNYKGRKILDMGMGDGRNLKFLFDLGFTTSGVEVSSEICEHVKAALNHQNVEADLRVGTNNKIPFDDSTFDYLLSWNSSYYMGEEQNYYQFRTNVIEFHRVLNKNGTIVLSVPINSNFIFENSEVVKNNNDYRIIKNDPYKIRNGQVFRCFRDAADLKIELSGYFTNLRTAELFDNCFGQKNHYLIIVGDKI